METITLERVPIPERLYNRGEAYRKGEESDHADYSVSLSPFNMPSLVEIGLNREARILTVKFIYPNSEPASKDLVDQDVTVLIGENSRKVLELRFAGTDKLFRQDEAAQIPTSLIERVGNKAVGAQRFVFEKTAQIANQVLARCWKDLRKQVAAATEKDS
jgi:hypothetical protein